jgi:uncharacterized protein (TIGR00297 family)
VSIGLSISLGLILNAGASLVAYRRGSVDPGGALAGALIGTIIFAAGGPLFWIILMTFFVTSTLMGMVRRSEKEWLSTVHQKGGRRDAVQVLANGGAGAFMALLYRLTGDPAWAAGFAVSFASSNADTWGSEVGVLSRGAPVSLLTFRAVHRGVSGGVSVLGTAVSLAGAACIALVFAAENLALSLFGAGFVPIALFVTAGGLLGSLLDSLLGASVQAQYAAASASSGQAGAHGQAGARGQPRVTERSVTEGVRNNLVRGFPFVTNDLVNFASCAVVTAAAVLASPLLG